MACFLTDGICARPASPAERPARLLAAPPSPSAASSPKDQSVTPAPETNSAGDEKPSKLGSPSEPDADQEAEPETNTETEEEKARRLLYCSLCKVAVNSASQLEAHNSGKTTQGPDSLDLLWEEPVYLWGSTYLRLFIGPPSSFRDEEFLNE